MDPSSTQGTGGDDEVTFASHANVKGRMLSIPMERRLELVGGRLRCSKLDGQPIFDVPVAELGPLKAPWYYWNTAFKVRAGKRKYLCAFTKLSNNGLSGASVARRPGGLARWRHR